MEKVNKLSEENSKLEDCTKDQEDKLNNVNQ